MSFSFSLGGEESWFVKVSVLTTRKRRRKERRAKAKAKERKRRSDQIVLLTRKIICIASRQYYLLYHVNTNKQLFEVCITSDLI